MLRSLKQYLTGPDQYLSGSDRLVILRWLLEQGLVWKFTIHEYCWNSDPKQDSRIQKKHILSMDLNISIRLTDFLLLKKRVLIIQFNGEIINIMLPTKFV